MWVGRLSRDGHWRCAREAPTVEAARRALLAVAGDVAVGQRCLTTGGMPTYTPPPAAQDGGPRHGAGWRAPP